MKLIAFVATIFFTECAARLKFDTKAFVNKFGYPLLEYDVETSDGYQLTLHRIPYGRKNNTVTNREVVFLMHGLMGSSENWLVLGPPKALAFYLADRGYDVWMGNARGTMHSRKHNKLSPDSEEFWDFSWHEIGVYDLPAMIDFIIGKTGSHNMFYVGHSQGTTSFFVMGSERPDYMKKIKLFAALAPVAYLSHMKHPLMQVLSRHINILEVGRKFIQWNEAIPHNDLLNILGKQACDLTAITKEICANVLFLIGGYDSAMLDREIVPLIMETAPAGASMKQFVHYGQLIKKDLISCIYSPLSSNLCDEEYSPFKQFDYGLDNYDVYNASHPPLYNLENVNAPTLLLYGNNDLLVSNQDAGHVKEVLPNVVDFYLIPFEKFSHLDFIYGKHADELVYDVVYKYFQQYK